MLRNCFLLALLFVVVLLLNQGIISLDLMYAEQPMLYAANQSLHSLRDFMGIYTHPQVLDVFYIPFFRPSGHFLAYQLLMPILGWHNTQGLIVVNLFFLSMIGLMLIKIYENLFPGFKVGGYLAFAFYLMHPALMLSRLIILHFDFAYVFFSLLSIYLFILYCRKLDNHFFLLFAALFFYAVAVSFKESALMIGPVLFVYAGLNIRQSKIRWQTLLLITVLSLFCGIYLSLAWPSLQHPLKADLTVGRQGAAAIELIKILLGLPLNSQYHAILHQPDLFWRFVQFTFWSRVLIAALFLMLLAIIASQPRNDKSLLFLLIAALLCLIMPVYWAMAMPWHLSLTLAFLSLMLGFGSEYFFQEWLGKKLVAKGMMAVLILALLWASPSVYQANINYILMKNDFAFRLGHNAVFHPPVLKEKLNADSILVVEDSFLHDSYALGNADYPYYLRQDLDYDQWQKIQAYSFIKRQPVYNGYLFKWAYLMPDLREEVYPFEVNHLDKVPNPILHDWLQHRNNIFCVGYDRQGNWQDKTGIFRRNLLREQNRRFLLVNTYEPMAARVLQGEVIYTKSINFPVYQICQYECDQNVQCKGFTYEDAEYHFQSKIKCQFYEALSLPEGKFCATCIGFVKKLV